MAPFPTGYTEPPLAPSDLLLPFLILGISIVLVYFWVKLEIRYGTRHGKDSREVLREWE